MVARGEAFVGRFDQIVRGPCSGKELVACLKVAFVLHLFYEDQWEDFAQKLGNLQTPFKLFVSLRPDSHFENVIRQGFPDAVIRRAPNRGRDVAPFLHWLPALQSFDVICKLQSKRVEGAHFGWRQVLVDGLVGSPDIVETYLEAFIAEPELALAGPRAAYIDGHGHLYQSARALRLLHGTLPDVWGFFAGTMFWCRPQVFLGLDDVYPQDCFLAHSDGDSHPEHAAERSFGIVVSQADKKIMLFDHQVAVNRASKLRGDPSFQDIYDIFGKDVNELPLVVPVLQEDVRPSLMQLYDNHRGYVSDKWSGNISIYDRILAHFRDSPVRMLEIGVQNGGSLEIWATYFSEGVIFIGCDIDECCQRLTYEDERINVIVADGGGISSKTKIAEICGQLDLIIDDGSHVSRDILKAFLLHFPTLTVGGLYIVEDLHCSYWSSHDGGLDAKTSSLAFFRMLSDFINRQHWEKQHSVHARFECFAQAYNLEIDVGEMEAIVSIEFANSMVIIRKGTRGESQLGWRLLRGATALVNQSVLEKDATRDAGGYFLTDEQNSKIQPVAAIEEITVSVVIAFYNGSAFLPDAIRSLAEQSQAPLEIIVVDDGSTREEAAWLQAFAKDAAFGVITQENKGQGAARNAGFQSARGTHVCLLDQDDIFVPTHIEILCNHWRAVAPTVKTLGWVFGDLRLINEHGEDMGVPAFPHRAEPTLDSIEGMIGRDLCMYPSATMFDRAAVLCVGGFDERFRGYEDDDLFLRLFLQNYRGSFYPDEITYWRYHGNQTSQGHVMLDSAAIFYEKWSKYQFDDEIKQALVRASLKSRMLNTIKIYQKRGGLNPARIMQLFQLVEEIA